MGLTFFCFTEFVALPCADSGGPSRFGWPVAGGPVCVRCRWGQSAELQADLGSATYPWEWQGTHSTPKTQLDATGSHLNKSVNRNCSAGQQVTNLTVELHLSSCCLFFNFDPLNMHIITFFFTTLLHVFAVYPTEKPRLHFSFLLLSFFSRRRGVQLRGNKVYLDLDLDH